jgi:excinuclease ABC subunit A
MSKAPVRKAIKLRGVRQNNLKNFDLDLPLGQLVVITGLSGSGKSSLAFDTLFAEGQRRYIETFSPYARQFFDRMDKPQVDSIEGIPPAIAIEQRNAVRTTRSTVGTMTEICDYLKLLWPHISELHCQQCGEPVRKDAPQQVWHVLQDLRDAEVLITFELPLTEKLPLAESLSLIAKQGYQRLWLDGEVVRLEDAAARLAAGGARSVTVVQDRLPVSAGKRARFVEACEQAYHFGKGKVSIHPPSGPVRRFSNRFHCAACDVEYREATPALFSFNHPLGACPACRGFGRTISIDYHLAMPDRTLTLTGGVVKPWQSGVSADCQKDMAKFCKARGIRMDVPFNEMSKELQDWVIEGDPSYGKDKAHEWPRAWYGVKGYFRWLESKSYKMHVRVLLSRYRSYTTCLTCNGKRFQPEALRFKATFAGRGSLTLADFYQLPVRDAWDLVRDLVAQRKPGAADPLGVVFQEVEARLGYLVEVGLGYLTLDRPTRSLSGGETERVNLTTCLGTRLVNTLFVLDEPSVGLHPRDTERLVRILQRLRDTGNTVVVVEHEASVMRAADQIIDLGPGHGESGGQLVFQGSFAEILKSSRSLTGEYLSGRKRIDVPLRRPVAGVTPPLPRLTLAHATLHNLQDLTVSIPLGRFVGITGVSGSGKTTLIREVLMPLLNAKFGRAKAAAAEEPESAGDDESESTGSTQATLTGWDTLGRVVMVDQSSLGKTPRSNPAVYIGAFEDLRELFAQSEIASQRGLNASAFSFNSAQGQCERCRGAGFEKIEMQFLSDIFIRCPECNGRRYRPHILDVKLPPGDRVGADARRFPSAGWSIADLLEAPVDEAVAWLETFGNSRPARRAEAKLKLLQEVGLGYLRLGQAINTLSGGESQRLKLVSHLAEAADAEARLAKGRPLDAAGMATQKPALFLFDEPTTGLHFDDVRVLLKVFQRLVDAGHSVLVIEHNLEVIRAVDWVIDLGPDAGDEGGRIVAEGTPERVATVPESHTGRALASDHESAAKTTKVTC